MGLAGSEGEGHSEGEREQREGLGRRDGDIEGERSLASGEPGARGGEGGRGSLRKSGGRRASLYERWKKFSTLLLRINVLKERERFRRWSCRDREGWRGDRRGEKQNSDGGKKLEKYTWEKTEIDPRQHLQPERDAVSDKLLTKTYLK